MTREPGQHIEVVFGIGDDPFLVMPVTVVADNDECIAHYLAAGTRYLRKVMADGSDVPRVVPFERLRREGSKLVEETWRGSNRLIVTRPGQAHAVFLKWRADTWEFTGWYVNLQAPLERTAYGFLTQDQFLDITVSPDGSWMWKDEDELQEAVRIGRLSSVDAAAIRNEGERIIPGIEARRWPFDGSLINWRPDPAWGVPEPGGREWVRPHDESVQ